MNHAPRILYHFTSRAWWHFAKSEGLNKGRVPLSPTEALLCPNLTSNPEPSAQRWACVEDGGFNKTAVRIAVEIPPGDEKLIAWREFADRAGVDPRWYRGLDESGGWEARNWWLYLGAVPPEWFAAGELHDGGELGRLDAQMLRVCEQSASYGEALRRMAVRYEDGVQLLNPFAATVDEPSRPAPARPGHEGTDEEPWPRGWLRARLHDPDLHAEIEWADVIFGLDPRTGRPSRLVHGADRFERMIEGNKAVQTRILTVPVDSATDDPEVIHAMVRLFKGTPADRVSPRATTIRLRPGSSTGQHRPGHSIRRRR